MMRACVAASGTSVGVYARSRAWRFLSLGSIGGAMLPHPDKAKKGGEDALFTATANNITAFGVFDGVGGWADQGVDPGKYSKGLASQCEIAFIEDGLTEPLSILEKAYHRSEHLIGSCTATVLVAEGDKLRTSNLGDSGFMLIRGSEIIYRSSEMQHYFNCPYQIGTSCQDKPKDSMVDELTVEPNDIVVVATDGVFDNLYNEEIMALITAGLKKGETPQEMANTICQQAYDKGSKTSGVSTPFADHARLARLQFEGGKLDDNTAIVAVFKD